MNPTQAATQQLQPVYQTAGQQLNAQVPAIANLYTALIGGLGNQAGLQQQNVMQSAQQRGLVLPQLQQQTQDTLGQTLLQQTQRLGAQQAQDTAAAQLGIGKLGTQQVSNVNQLAGTLQDLSGIQQKAAMQHQQDVQQYNLGLQDAKNSLAVNQAQAAASAARQSAAADKLTASQALELTRAQFKPGKDGYINPTQWNQLRQYFIAAGFSGGAFDSEFGAFANPAHQDRARTDLTRYEGLSLVNPSKKGGQSQSVLSQFVTVPKKK